RGPRLCLRRARRQGQGVRVAGKSLSGTLRRAGMVSPGTGIAKPARRSALRHVDAQGRIYRAVTVNTEQRRLAAIMFTDMVGYSTLAQRDDKLALELLEEHRQLLREIFPR